MPIRWQVVAVSAVLRFSQNVCCCKCHLTGEILTDWGFFIVGLGFFFFFFSLYSNIVSSKVCYHGLPECGNLVFFVRPSGIKEGELNMLSRVMES